MGRMNALMLFAGLALGVLLGVAIGILLARGRQAGEVADLRAAASAADERARAAEDKRVMAERAADERADLIDSQLAERFQVLSSQALDASTARFLEMAEGRLQAANTTAAGE